VPRIDATGTTNDGALLPDPVGAVNDSMQSMLGDTPDLRNSLAVAGPNDVGLAKGDGVWRGSRTRDGNGAAPMAKSKSAPPCRCWSGWNIALTTNNSIRVKARR